MTFREIRTWLQIAPYVGIEDLDVLVRMGRTALLQLRIPNDLVNRLLRDEQPAVAGSARHPAIQNHTSSQCTAAARH